jgi:hypothetical protein
VKSRAEASGFRAVISFEARRGGVTLRFSAPMNPKEFGIGFDAVSAWNTVWADDRMSVALSFAEPVVAGRDVTLLLFRAADASGNMISAPVKFKYTAE